MKSYTIPSNYRELAKGETVLDTDIYFASQTANPCSKYGWSKGKEVYGQGVLSSPGEAWCIARLVENDGWTLLSEKSAPYGQRVMFSNGTRVRINTTSFSNDTHWRPLPALPVAAKKVDPDTDFSLNYNHAVLVKGDKSGVMVGPSKRSFVPASKVKEIAALLVFKPVPDTTIALNYDHSVIVKGDKSGIIVGCDKDSFVPAIKVTALAALL